MRLNDCFKTYTRDQDKACDPVETVRRVKALLDERCAGVLAETDRVDTGRLGIPVFVSVCGPEAARFMPTRKQMGKGASPEQAEASALMELVERYSFFTFWADEDNFERLTWSEAEARWPGKVMDVGLIARSVDEDMDPADAVRLMDLVRWRFHPALNVLTGEEERVPLDWFKKLNEFNGSSAGNTYEESISQGANELIERHVCALIDRARPEVPTIDPASSGDPVLARLVKCFADNGVELLLKDFSLGYPAPTVAAVAWDPKTFPALSEIVFTAGTAASPVKAAIRAVTEVAQLAGDFETSRVYEASGLPKFTDLSQLDWLKAGERVALDALPSVEDDNILVELRRMAGGLADKGTPLYAVSTAHPELGVPANYSFVPGFDFRERTQNRSIGLFVGRILAEDEEFGDALEGLEVLEGIYPDAYFLPFFKGLLALRMGDAEYAADQFAEAEPLQPADAERGLAAFYAGYALSQAERWEEAVAPLTRAVGYDDECREYFNLRGVAHFKAGRYAEGAADFQASLNIDSGSPHDLANLGLCHKFMGNRSEAMDFLGAALDMDPSLDYARKHLEELKRS
ncbi:YcaO-like family protein [Pseudodesulfovibrio sp.]|uniref:YcaO-like family protein n=1 Tax=Pseudodesulfovibrio sp. TaxID=2035812 RepID=UPI002627E0EF|nr:YcaO-like family protein [Pseudodesulfovibrio sp.]MDD3310653.1 YcaO-like family protein [Pseudodesulfovibrio sp.]